MNFLALIANFKFLKGFLRSVFAVFAVLLYLSANTEFEVIHKILEPQSIQSHSNHAEEDPCHRAIFHDEPEQTCGHESHVLLKSKCEFCDALCKSDKFIENIIFATRATPIKEFADRISKHSSDTKIITLSSRGPPQL